MVELENVGVLEGPCVYNELPGTSINIAPFSVHSITADLFDCIKIGLANSSVWGVTARSRTQGDYECLLFDQSRDNDVQVVVPETGSHTCFLKGAYSAP